MHYNVNFHENSSSYPKGFRIAPQGQKSKNFFLKFKKMTYLRVILCEKSIARIPEAWKPCWTHTWASRGYWAPKYELVPKVTVDQKKRRQAKKSKYEFVLDLWIRIQIFTTNSVWVASQIWIGPLIFPPIRRIRGVTVPPPLAHVWLPQWWKITYVQCLDT